MNVLIVGGDGQVGKALQQTAPRGARISAANKSACNITEPDQIEHWFDLTRPELVFNAAAYTAVDAAEEYPLVANAINVAGATYLAKAASRHGARLVHISTDFVFDGRDCCPYRPDSAPNPLNVYGLSKLRSEREIIQHAPSSLIVRTSWVYAERGKNFVATILRLLSERDEIRVVADQIGTPTYARNLASMLWALSDRNERGLFHFADNGLASWYDFAQSIEDEALALNILPRSKRIIPITSAEYPTAAVRPRYSVLDTTKSKQATGIQGQHWRHGLRDMLRKVHING